MTDTRLYELLGEFISENKRGLFERIAPLRTRHVTIVLEDIYQSQNASAVLRTCDLIGVQDIHVIEQRNNYRVDDQVALGSSQWVDVIPYRSQENNTQACMKALRAKGYRIIATSPRGDASTPETIDLGRPMAFCFGTELTGLSDAMIEGADEHLRIPMHGFTESYNISVSAAITLYTVMHRLRNSDINWRLSESDSLALRLEWVRTVLQSSDLIEARLRANEASHNAS